ncbi:hypothetical protein PPYR_13145 [Photinus pyralis]|uniref:Protein C10 n=1 Tax=Photinus pyralis TaxID=7054 RepID=A0A1Y1KHI7_PHOPY|nr:protein C10 [Photinus pyralis]KAB0793525.1 hypothetical protein PPYR_13145 [Photinus pyralis]
MSKEINLTSELAITILSKVLDQLQESSNVQKLEEAKDNVGNEMLKMMQYIFPIVMQVEMDVIKDFGFPEGREGIVKFAQLLRTVEREDIEVARVHGLIKAYYLPPVSVNATNETTNDDRVG